MYGFYREKLHVHHFWELKGYGFFMTVHKNGFSLQFHHILKLKEKQKEIIIQGKAGVFMASSKICKLSEMYSEQCGGKIFRSLEWMSYVYLQTGRLWAWLWTSIHGLLMFADQPQGKKNLCSRSLDWWQKWHFCQRWQWKKGPQNICKVFCLFIIFRWYISKL